MADSLLAGVVALVVDIIVEALLYPALNPLLTDSASKLGPLGLLIPIVVWAGPPASLTAALALAARAQGVI